jgi:hypothetical protein
MTQRSNSVREEPIVSDARIRDVMRRLVDSAVNIERVTTRQGLANDSGVNIHTIDALLSRDEAKHRPIRLEVALSLAAAIGERAVNSLVGVIGYAAAPLDGEDELRPMQLVADMMQPLATIAAAAADGRFDHTELPACTEAADLIIATILPLSSAHAGGAR